MSAHRPIFDNNLTETFHVVDTAADSAEPLKQHHETGLHFSPPSELTAELSGLPQRVAPGGYHPWSASVVVETGKGAYTRYYKMQGYIKYTKDCDDNKSESARLHDQHDVLLHAMGDRAILAPVDFSRRYLRVLDSGAGDGRWLFDLRQYLDANGADAGTYHYVGTDINPSLYPKSPPPHIEFFNQSILDSFPTKWHGTFDIVHQRLVMAAVAPPATTITSVVAELGGLLRPGGWLQLVELDNDCTPENGPALRRLLYYHQQNSEAGGLGPNLSVHLKTAMENIDLENIKQHSVDVFYGAKNQGGEDLRAKSTRSLSQVVGPVLAQARVASPNTYIKSDEITLPSQLQQEVEEVGARLRFTVVYGQKRITS